jgi:hypothetical protein
MAAVQWFMLLGRGRRMELKEPATLPNVAKVAPPSTKRSRDWQHVLVVAARAQATSAQALLTSAQALPTSAQALPT